MSRHARPRPPVMPLLAGAAVGVALVVACLVAFSHVVSGPVTSWETSPVPGNESASPEALEPSEAPESCERTVTRALVRYAQVRFQGGDTALALAIEQRRLSPLEYRAFSSVINDLDMLLADPSRQVGVGDAITSVMPTVRRICRTG